MSQRPPRFESILVMGPNWIGDAVMSTPVLANLRRELPTARIDLLIPRYMASLFEEHPAINRIWTHDGRLPWPRRLASLLAIRRHRYEAMILLPNSLRAALYGRLVGAPVRVGYATDGRAWLLTHAVYAEAGGPPPHQVASYLRLVRALGLPVIDEIPKLHASLQARKTADDLWTRHGLATDDSVIGICPGAAFGPAKRWWPARFAALADRLIDDGGWRVVFFGSVQEMPLVEQIRALMEHEATSLAGQDSLDSFKTLVARCAVVIANDSGSMHIASAMGTPVVSIFGPTDPRRTAPMNPLTTVLRRALPCSPCFQTTCPFADHPCMRLIEVDEVYGAVSTILGINPSTCRQVAPLNGS